MFVNMFFLNYLHVVFYFHYYNIAREDDCYNNYKIMQKISKKFENPLDNLKSLLYNGKADFELAP